eukprot:256523-Chlamydomonas_euryale.AAC.3
MGGKCRARQVREYYASMRASKQFSSGGSNRAGGEQLSRGGEQFSRVKSDIAAEGRNQIGWDVAHVWRQDLNQ